MTYIKFFIFSVLTLISSACALRNPNDTLGISSQDIQALEKEVISKLQSNSKTQEVLKKIIAFTSEPDIFLGIFNGLIYPQYIKPTLKGDVANIAQDIVNFMNENKEMVGLILQEVNAVASHFNTELDVANKSKATAGINQFLDSNKKTIDSARASYNPLITARDLALDDPAFINRLQEVFKVELNELKNDPIVQSAEATGSDAEYKRTLVCLLSLKWVLQGEYDKLVRAQNPAVKLTAQQFEALRTYTTTILPTQQARDAMFWFLANNDMGKDKLIEEAVNEGRAQKITDHDMILAEILKHYDKYKHFIPTWAMIDPEYQQLILESLEADFNYGQALQAENLPANWQGLVHLSKKALNLFNVHAIFDIAGAAGWLAPSNEIWSKGSITLGKPAFTSMTLLNEALEEGLAAHQGAEQLYNNYLSKQANRLQFDINTPEHRAIMRLALMVRAGSNADVQRVITALNELDKNNKALFIRSLNATGINDSGILLYYGPALLQNAMLTATTPEDKTAALAKAFALMFSIFNSVSKKKLPVGVYTVDVGPVARTIKKDAKIFNELNPQEVRYKFQQLSSAAAEIDIQ